MPHPNITGVTRHRQPTREQHTWHKWFAWRPVRLTLTNERVWLRVVYRRAYYKTYATYDDWQLWEYADILGILRLPPEPPKQRR